jgi:hypothetical protein
MDKPITGGVGEYLVEGVWDYVTPALTVAAAMIDELPAAGERSAVGNFWVAFRRVLTSGVTSTDDLDFVVADLDAQAAERLLQDARAMAAVAERHAADPAPTIADLRLPWERLVAALIAVRDQARAVERTLYPDSVAFEATVALGWLERIEANSLEGSGVDRLTWQVLSVLDTAHFTPEELVHRLYPRIGSRDVRRILDDCVERKLVKRWADDVLVLLTPVGRQVLGSVSPAVEQGQRRIEQALPAADMELLRALLRQLIDSLASGRGGDLAPEPVRVRSASSISVTAPTPAPADPRLAVPERVREPEQLAAHDAERERARR